jgi:bifunctional DNA-binding transcriptional regulator/antitoxin component of YhaV-PrlF toxin-antitoxin module
MRRFLTAAALNRAGRRFIAPLLVMYFCITMQLNEEHPMTTLTVTARGQVTFRKKVLQHLGIKPGEKIALDLLPNGRGMIRAARPTGRIQDFFGVLAGKTKKVATIEEMNDAAARGWAGKK